MIILFLFLFLFRLMVLLLLLMDRRLNIRQRRNMYMYRKSNRMIYSSSMTNFIIINMLTGFISSWLHEEEFDELMASLEAEAEGPHSLVYSDIEPFLINLTVRSHSSFFSLKSLVANGS